MKSILNSKNMKIFYVHSNICILVIYDSVMECIKNGDDVIIITAKGVSWPFDSSGISIICLPDNINYATSDGIRNINQVIEAWKRYRTYEKYANKIINGKNFILFIPCMTPFIVSLVNNSKCLGYYFVEEGELAYNTLYSVKRNTRYSTIKYFVSKILGIRYNFLLSCNAKFEGTVAISTKAFEWNKRAKKIINRIPVEKSVTQREYDKQYNIIVLSHLHNYGINDVCRAILFAYNYFKKNRFPIALKFHPRSRFVENDRVQKIIQYIKNENIKIEILPSDFYIEVNTLQYKSNIISVFIMSSVCRYAKIAGSDVLLLGRDDSGNYSLEIIKE